MYFWRRGEGRKEENKTRRGGGKGGRVEEKKIRQEGGKENRAGRRERK